MIGPAPYKLIRSLLSPELPVDKTFEELAQTLSNHYSPPPSEVIQRFRFNSRCRQAGESVAAYVADLRRLAEFCNFGTTLKKMLRDRLVSGVNSESIQKKLLGERDLTYERALAIAQGSEEADRNLREMRGSTEKHSSMAIKQEPVHQLQTSYPARNTEGKRREPHSGGCYRCGGTGHKPSDCRFKEVTCNSCRKKGHIARVCRSNKTKQEARPVGRICEDSEESEEDFENYILAVKSPEKPMPPLKVRMVLDDCSLPMEIDTGASRSIMSEPRFKKLWPNKILEPSEIKLKTYSQEPLPVVGSVDVRVKYGEQSATLPLLIVKGDGPTLFGRDWMSIIRGKIPIAGTPRKIRGGISRWSGHGRKARIEVDPMAKPRYCKARTLPYAMRPRKQTSGRRRYRTSCPCRVGNPISCEIKERQEDHSTLWRLSGYRKSRGEVGPVSGTESGRPVRYPETRTTLY